MFSVIKFILFTVTCLIQCRSLGTGTQKEDDEAGKDGSVKLDAHVAQDMLLMSVRVFR